MAGLGLTILLVLLFLVTVMFIAGVLLDFIRPSVLQIQLMGIQITVFGIVAVLAFDGLRGFGFTIGIMGLLVGVFGSFRETPAANAED